LDFGLELPWSWSLFVSCSKRLERLETRETRVLVPLRPLAGRWEDGQGGRQTPDSTCHHPSKGQWPCTHLQNSSRPAYVRLSPTL
jgi:hypothetical protein